MDRIEWKAVGIALLLLAIFVFMALQATGLFGADQIPVENPGW